MESQININFFATQKMFSNQSNCFIGRKPELAQLNVFKDKNTASFIVIKGRRRIGKSRFVDEFSKYFEQYYKFEGLAPEKHVTATDQIVEFCHQLSRQFQTPFTTFNDWSDALWVVGEQVKSGKILLFFDEIAWMASQNPTFLGKIKNAWDNWFSKNPQLVFIVCSSASAWIEKNLLSSTGFVGRVSFTLTLDELPVQDCGRFWPNNISAFEKFKVLAVTGGVPKYLEEINPKLSAEENIKRLCFTHGGLLVNEFDRIFSDIFMRDSPFYEKIVTLLANGPKEQTDIRYFTDKTTIQAYGRMPEYLCELEEAGFISRDFTWNLTSGKDSKLSVYRLKDNYLRFYLHYIRTNLTKIKRGAFHLKSLSNLPEWQTIMGLQFENLVLNNRKQLHALLNIQPDEIVNENPFFQRATKSTLGCQIDYMVQTKFNCLYICEIKFSKHPVSSDVIRAVQEKIDRLKRPKGFSCRPVLIHANGVTSDLMESDYFAAIIDFGQLFNETV